jgi:cobalt-zinc-cadmium efflux system protein
MQGTHHHDHRHDHDGHHHGDRHQHGHQHGAHIHAPVRFGTAFAIGAALNIALVAGQLVTGALAHSMALIADAVHNLGDVLGLLLAWLAASLGTRGPSAGRSYGWGRGSIMAALANAMILLVGSGAIAIEALQRLASPQPVAGGPVMAMAAAGIVINGVTALLFSRGHDDLNIRATFLHMAGDAAVSAGVLVGAFLIGLTGWLWIDPLVGLAIVAVILAGTWGVLREAAHLAFDGVPQRIAEAEVQAYLATLPGVIEVHDLHIWALSTTEVALTAHLVRSAEADDQSLIRSACDELGRRFHIGHATLQVETADLAAGCRLRPAGVI